MKFWQVDSFTDTPFKGNPAGVLILDQEMDDSIKQNIAMELNLSETAFVHSGESGLGIKWFTPNAEVNLCGHATLAAAHVLWTEKFFEGEELAFDSRSGILKVRKDEDGIYTLIFPVQEASERPDYLELVRDILDKEPKWVGSNGEDCVAVVEDLEFLKNYIPKHELISKLPERGFLLTAKDQSGKYDFIYRAFFPKLDVPEDPVTGSANTLLCPFWARVLKKDNLKGYQASKRGGEVIVRLNGGKVEISGRAVTVIKGDFLLS